MKIDFPNSKKMYLQNNRTNVYPLGNVWSSLSLDLQSNLGALRISPRLKMSTSSSNDSNLGCPVAFRWFDTKMWAVCDTHVFGNNGTTDGAWTIDGSTGAQTDYSADSSDMEIFNDALCATTSTHLVSKADSGGSGNGAWTQRDSINTGTNHVMTYFKRFNRLYYADLGDNIKSSDPNWTIATVGNDYALDMSPASSTDYQIACLASNESYVWIGTIDALSQGRTGKLSQWDGISAQVTAEFDANNAQGILAIAIDPLTDNPYVMDSNGVLSAFNGSGLQEVGRLPLPFSQLPYNVASANNERFVHPNGMYFTKNGTIRVLVNNRPEVSTSPLIENFPSGVWEWSKNTGFVHVQSLSYTPAGTSTVTDWGQNKINRIGALVSMNVPVTSNMDGSFMAGATVYTDATTTKSAIFFDNSTNDVQKKGYVVTDWFESDDIADSFNSWWTSFRQRPNSTDEMVWKYRNVEQSPVEVTITWVDTQNFTVPNSSMDMTTYFSSATGLSGEVEVLRGVGSGLCAHISNAVLAAGTWTVTIDETATGATTTTATARFQNWIKLFPSETVGSLSTWTTNTISSNSTPRIQLKGCFTQTGIGEFYKGTLVSNNDITSKL